HRFRALFRRKTVEEELDDELRFHLEREAEKHTNSGVDRDEALRRARLAFGGLDQVKEECRQARGVSALDATIQERHSLLSGLAAHCSNAPLFVTANQQSRLINGAVVSANFFTVLRVTPTLGRFFRQDEDRVPDRDRVAVLSYELWRNWFGSSPDVPGRTLK